ncbi:transposase [Corallococcus sp. EGB]|uniref:transposase n=1 Tax=Corallococcus sp. EGB TaxID=1521117 RepID=UPI00351D6946
MSGLRLLPLWHGESLLRGGAQGRVAFREGHTQQKESGVCRSPPGHRQAVPEANTIHLVLDNLSTHSRHALEVRYGVCAGRRLWRRFTPYYTPVHGSRLNQAEVEISVLSRQCLGRRRIPTLDKLRCETQAWQKWANRHQLRIRWRFTVPKARAKFHYHHTDFTRS